MNEYQEKQDARDRQFEAELAAIASELGSDWEVKPWDGEGYGSRWRELTDTTSYRTIGCHRYRAGSQDRIEFKASNWPSYTDESGRDFTCWPTDLYPKEVTPACTAAAGREAKPVARAINRLLPEYNRIWTLCEQRAEESGSYYAKTREAIKQLCEATGNTYKADSTYHSYFLRGLEGSQSVKFNSVGSVDISLDTEDMLAVIDLLYRRKTGKSRRAKYTACPECGCTDVQVAAWIMDNTEQVEGTGEEGPRNQAYCSQCEENGNEGDIGSCAYLVEAEERKPFEKLTDTQRQLFEIREG